MPFPMHEARRAQQLDLRSLRRRNRLFGEVDTQMDDRAASGRDRRELFLKMRTIALRDDASEGGTAYFFLE